MNLHTRTVVIFEPKTCGVDRHELVRNTWLVVE